MRVRVQVSQLQIDLVPGEPVTYRKGQVFECPEERALKLGNSVLILPDPEPVENPAEPPGPEKPPGRKRR